jgi:hypothetical protein
MMRPDLLLLAIGRCAAELLVVGPEALWWRVTLHVVYAQPASKPALPPLACWCATC